MKYHHKKIEKKWQHEWEKRGIFATPPTSIKPKYYVLDMFPYPSGSGLHVGHVVGYTATDIIARYRRMCGFDVLHPMGWDSFGLPAEQYAVRTGQHPRATTDANIATYRRQLKSLGFSYDWSREFATSDPKFYKWTQWIFTKLVERGLAYEAEMLVNWCPALETVLANEEIEDGKSKDGGHPVERRPLRQWVLRITKYADRLLDDLALLDWPEAIIKQQRHWIGRSEGVRLTFKVAGREEQIECFTTRQDTLFGVTYVVLAPEHPIVDRIVTPAQQSAIASYRTEAAARSDLERTELAKEKTGVWTGAYAVNPGNGEEVPVWIADYVLAGYGTGAVIGVPAHCDRDFDFAQRFNLPSRAVIDPGACPEREEVLAGRHCWMEDGLLIASGEFNGLSVEEAKHRIGLWLEEQGCGERSVSYRLRDWLFSRQRYWGEPIPVLHFADGTSRTLALDELPLLPPEVEDYRPTPEGHSPIAKVKEWVEIVDPVTGKRAVRETNTMPQWAGSCWYYVRFCDPHNDQAACSKELADRWLPVDMYIGGAEHAVLHLLYSRFWCKVLHDCGLVATTEPFQRLFNQGMVTSRSYRIPGGVYVDPAEAVEKGGRYVTRDGGVDLLSQIEKMSKSKLNVITPDEVIEEFGADALRLYEMFMGPLDKEKVWNTDGVSGCRRFLFRFFDLVHGDKLSDDTEGEGIKLAHRLVSDVARDIEALSFNTAVSTMMEFVNHFSKLERYPRTALLMATQALSPFAPHIAEECWVRLGGVGELSYAPWPTVNPAYLVDEMITYVIQVNGKLRGRFELPKDQDEEKIVALARSNPLIAKHITGEIAKVVFVPNRLLNFVLR
jgi:leucyl-tRNA synthetase